jgi:hypothetical protein
MVGPHLDGLLLGKPHDVLGVELHDLLQSDDENIWNLIELNDLVIQIKRLADYILTKILVSTWQPHSTSPHTC